MTVEVMSYNLILIFDNQRLTPVTIARFYLSYLN